MSNYDSQRETEECVKALKELLEIVENAEWTNPDMPSWEYEQIFDEAVIKAQWAIRTFGPSLPHSGVK